ncbi:MAG: hypothetical protein JSW34_00845 [Candidatus Zixiibacteriota bacterium]|nr:MAG: hypothetical protein JSW34_00845 [candidate division Zixibacteria bacterium]
MIRYVVILKDGDEYKVAGGRLKAERGHTVRFYNFADAPATVSFDTVKPIADFTLETEGGKKDWPGIESGYYPYTVMVGKQEATASKPIVIVYP